MKKPLCGLFSVWVLFVDGIVAECEVVGIRIDLRLGGTDTVECMAYRKETQDSLRDYISYLAWEQLDASLDELEEVTMAVEVWAFLLMNWTGIRTELGCRSEWRHGWSNLVCGPCGIADGSVAIKPLFFQCIRSWHEMATYTTTRVAHIEHSPSDA